MPKVKVSYTDVAQWIHSEHPGATAKDVRKHFNLDSLTTGTRMAAIRKAKRYVTRWEPGEGFPNAKDYKGGRLYVDEIHPAVNADTHWGGVTATRVHPIGDDGDVLHFRSAWDAEINGGFCNVTIYACLRGVLKSHGGYIWTPDNPNKRAVA